MWVSVHHSPTRLACHNSIGHVPGNGGEDVVGMNPCMPPDCKTYSWWMTVLFLCCRTNSRTVYTTHYRTVYSSQRSCCHGYTQAGTQCLRKPAAIALCDVVKYTWLGQFGSLWLFCCIYCMGFELHACQSSLYSCSKLLLMGKPRSFF